MMKYDLKKTIINSEIEVLTDRMEKEKKKVLDILDNISKITCSVHVNSAGKSN